MNITHHMSIILCRYLRLILQYSDVIVGQFYGHQNTDTFRVFYNSKRKSAIILVRY